MLHFHVLVGICYYCLETIGATFFSALTSVNALFYLRRELSHMIFKKTYNLEKLYAKVAEQYGVTVEEVKRDMTEAMKLSNSNIDNLDEFVLTLICKVKRSLEEQNIRTN